MKILHYDLFAGIGGFSYAVDQVYGKENVKHIFVEINPFCRAVLKKHWKNGEYYDDIREFIIKARVKIQKENKENNEITFLTGGFPCQPFSQAGKRRGTQDNRFLWPEMFRVIQLIKPQWVIAENVYGLFDIEGGLVFEQVCSDLETEGYEVQPFIVPAVSVNAPHRRDRVWIVGRRKESDVYQWRGVSGGCRGLRGSYKTQMEDLQICGNESGRKEESQNNITPQISNECTEGNGNRPHQQKSFRQPQGESSNRPSLLEYAQQEDTGWSPLTEGKTQMESNNLCEQSENLVGTIQNRRGSENGLRTSKRKIWTESSEEDGKIITHNKSRRNASREQKGNRDGKSQEKTGNRNSYASDATSKRFCRGGKNKDRQQSSMLGKNIQPIVFNSKSKQSWKHIKSEKRESFSRKDWERDWKEVAFATCLCGMDDGLPRQMDGITISPSKHRKERLKALGNAIVPQVAIEILKAIKSSNEEYLKLANELALKIIPKWDKDSLPVSTPGFGQEILRC